MLTDGLHAAATGMQFFDLFQIFCLFHNIDNLFDIVLLYATRSIKATNNTKYVITICMSASHSFSLPWGGRVLCLMARSHSCMFPSAGTGNLALIEKGFIVPAVSICMEDEEAGSEVPASSSAGRDGKVIS